LNRSETTSELFASTSGEECRDSFLRLYPGVFALSRESKVSDEAIELFHRSRSELETELQSYSSKTLRSRTELEEVSAKHAFLSLIYWLYPNHIGYNRARNAIKMFQHASLAQTTNQSNISFSYSVGQMIQLRITPFLIRSKKKTVADLVVVRSNAEEFLLQQLSARPDLSSLVSDGLGFSYFLFERDFEKALNYLRQGASYLETWEKESMSDETSSQVQFMQSFAAALYWDLGICYEGKVEGVEGDQLLEFLRTSRTFYEKSLHYAMKSPWHIYRAMSTYNLSGTYYREGSAQLEKEKAVPLLRRSVELGEESLRWFHLWSTFEEDFLGGSWIASFCQHLANYLDEASKEKLMQRSLELAQKADALISNKKVGLSRYKAVNIGDIFLRNSEYNRQVALENRSRQASGELSDEPIVTSLLDKSLADCLKSRTFYRDEDFQSRKISSDLLAGDICYDLLSSSENTEDQRKLYSSRARRYFHDVARISKTLGLKETLATSSWRLAQVFDKEGRFTESAHEYDAAHQNFELMRDASSRNSQLCEESSKYTQAWSLIEKAKSEHIASDFIEASNLYRDASGLIAQTKRWRSRSHLFLAKSLIEQAEKCSMSDSPEPLAVDLLSAARKSLEKLSSDLSLDNSIEARSFARLGRYLSSFCEARILLENSKLDFKTGEIESSVTGLSNASEVFSVLSRDYSLSNPVEANELESLSSFCKALTYFQKAQQQDDPALIQKAQEIFSSASENSVSTALKPLLRGLAGFASFLYSSKIVEQSLESSIDIEGLSQCSIAIESAERSLSRSGNRAFLGMLRASKHVLDASIKISAAEREVEDQESKARLYAQAQRSLTLASKYYEELGASEKLKESLRLLSTIKQNRELIPLANKMFAEIASSQMISSAISSTSVTDATPENSARQLDSSFISLESSIASPLISSGEVVSLTLVLTNLGKERVTANAIRDAVPDSFDFIPQNNETITLNGKDLRVALSLESGASEKISISIHPREVGEFTWRPTVTFHEAKGQEKATSGEALKVVVEVDDLQKVVEDLRSKKAILESELVVIQKAIAADDNKVFSLREELAKIEEELHRGKNEYENLNVQLDQVKQDLLALKEMQDEVLKQEERKRLETDEVILIKRIERRRPLFP
jgi:hypothetical protein